MKHKQIQHKNNQKDSLNYGKYINGKKKIIKINFDYSAKAERLV